MIDHQHSQPTNTPTPWENSLGGTLKAETYCQTDTAAAILNDIETFFGIWVQRCEVVLSQCRQLASREQELAHRESSLSQCAIDLSEQQQRWIMQRDVEVSYLQQQVEELTNAWMRLECEQRGLAASDPRSSRVRDEETDEELTELPTVSAITPPAAGPLGNGPQPLPAPTISRHVATLAPPPHATTGRPPTISQRSSPLPSATYTSPSPKDDSREAIRVQFEQLQRELGFGVRSTP